MATDFRGLNIRYVPPARVRNDYSMESLALVAIAAMKEEALRDFHAPLLGLDFEDRFHPENPIKLVMNAASETQRLMMRRSTVMWTLNAVPLALMHAQDMAYMGFIVRYGFRNLYNGLIAHRSEEIRSHRTENDSVLGQTSHASHSLSLAPEPMEATKMALRSLVNKAEYPRYEVDFNENSGDVLSAINVFESILGLLLRLGARGARSSIGHVTLVLAEYQVWIYMREVIPGAYEHAFQQFHAVAILEAIARHMVMHGPPYKELTFKFRANEQLVGDGCLTKAVQSSAWCEGLGGDEVPT